MTNSEFFILDKSVPKWQIEKTTKQLQESKSLRELYIALDSDDRVKAQVRIQGRASLNTEAETRQSITRRGKEIVSIKAPILIPVSKNSSASMLGHELAHVEEILDTGQSLETRAANGDKTVWRTGSRDRVGTYESEHAIETGDQIDLEVAAHREAMENGEVTDLVRVDWTCSGKQCRASIPTSVQE